MILRWVALLTCAYLCSGCATLRGPSRVLLGAMVGGAVGASGGALLSPNEESRAINALVFGLAASLAGGTVALLTDPNIRSGVPLKELESSAKHFTIEPQGELPAFVKDRMSPVVVQEATARDELSEDGTLHEPHKIYRILRPAELSVGRKSQTLEHKEASK